MCRHVDDVFDGIDDDSLSSTESYWVSTLSDAYARNGHLSRRQLAVLKDIELRNSHRSYSSSGSRRYYRKRRW